MRSQVDSQSLLSFRLTPQLQAVISVDDLMGLTTINTSEIAPIPDTPPAVMGIYSNHGKVVWIVDLPCLLGLTPLYLANIRQACSIIFLRHEQQVTGFAVHQVDQMLTLPDSQLQREYTTPGAQRLNWCISGVYAHSDATLLAMQGSKMFELLKINEMTA